MFAYCNNNPANLNDPKGQFGILTAIVIGVVVGVGCQYTKDVIENHDEGKTGLELFKPHSSWKDYLGSAVAGGVASIPTGGLLGSFAWGALGNVLGEGIKGNISNLDEGLSCAVKGGCANYIASFVVKAATASKVFEIDQLSRFDRKRILEEIIPAGNQAGWNGNLRVWSGASFFQQMCWANNIPGFALKSAVFSAIVSTGILEAN